MPRTSSGVPSYRFHKASGQAIVTLSGQMNYLGPFGSPASKLKYDQLVGEWLANFRLAPQDTPTETLSVVELAAAYWKFAKGYYRRDGEPTSTLIRIKVAIRILRETYGKVAVTEFGPLALRAIQDRLVTGGKSRRYINYLVDQIRRIFKWGVSQQLLPVTVYQALTTVAGLRRGRSLAKEPGLVLPVADDVVERTLPCLPAVVADMVRFQRLTGCRPGEVCILRPCDVETSGEIWQYRPIRHKTDHAGKQRIICIGPQAQALLRPYLKRGADKFCFSPAESEANRLVQRQATRKTPPTIGNHQGSNRKRKPVRQAGSKYSSASYLRAVTRGCEAAFGMPAELRKISSKRPPEERRQMLQRARVWRTTNCWTPNQLRHSAATNIRRHFGLEAAQVTLGHANADVTQVYAERDLTLAMRVMRDVG